MLNFENNAQYDARMQAGVTAGVGAAPAQDPFVTEVGRIAWKEFQAARDHRREVTDRMLADLRMLRREYDPEDMALIREEGGSQIYYPLVEQKIVIAAAMLYTIYIDQPRPFVGKPSPLPDVPPDIMAAIVEQAQAEAMQTMQAGAAGMVPPDLVWQRIEANKAEVLRRAQEWAQSQADYNAQVVDDVLREGGFYQALVPFFHNACAFLGGFLSVVVRNKTVLTWGPDGMPVKVRKPVRCIVSRSPFDLFPSAGSTSTQDGPLSIRAQMERAEVYEMIGVEGFSEPMIRHVLENWSTGPQKLNGWYWEDTERDRLLSMSDSSTVRGLSTKLDVIEHHTHIDGRHLIEFGLSPQVVTDPDKPYACTVYLCGPDQALGVRINDDPMEERPIWGAGFRKLDGSFWWEGACTIGRPMQRMANAASRAKSNNMAMAAGYVTEMQVDRLPNGQTVRQPRPYDVIQTLSARNGASGPAIFFNQPQMLTPHYNQEIGMQSQLLDEALGLPSFLAGLNPTGGAGGTSSGLQQLRSMQTQAFGYFTASIDSVIESLCRYLHRDLLLTPDETREQPMDMDSPRRLVGDVYFEARGARSLAERASTMVRLNELLIATANPVDMAILGKAGRAELLREAVSGFDSLDNERVVPPRDVLAMQDAMQAMQQAQMQAGQGNPEGPTNTDPAGQPMGAGNNMVAT